MAIEHISAILDPAVREKALARIGYYLDTKKRGRHVDDQRVLDWFVKLSRKNLATMRPTELRELREEVRALQQEGAGDVAQYQIEADTAAQLPKTQTAVAQYLEQLTKTGRIEFEPFTLITSILLPRFRPGATPSSYKHLVYGGEFVEPDHGKGLLYLFYLALKGAGERLRKCVPCTVLFVQTRRKQEHCSTRCRVRALRARQQKMREAIKTKRQRRAHAAGHTLTTQRRKSHGPKKHR